MRCTRKKQGNRNQIGNILQPIGVVSEVGVYLVTMERRIQLNLLSKSGKKQRNKQTKHIHNLHFTILHLLFLEACAMPERIIDAMSAVITSFIISAWFKWRTVFWNNVFHGFHAWSLMSQTANVNVIICVIYRLSWFKPVVFTISCLRQSWYTKQTLTAPSFGR